jgi:hypothetical protein
MYFGGSEKGPVRAAFTNPKNLCTTNIRRFSNIAIFATDMDFFSQISRDISRALSPELPQGLGTLDEHLDFVLPQVAPYGEDLSEPEYWQVKRWKEVRDDEGFHETILHIFNPGGEYLMVLDGNIMKGGWRQLGYENSLIIEMAGRGELFDLQFLHPEFLVLSKHGDQGRKGQRRYICLAYEPVTFGPGRDLDWRNIMERMFNIYRENSLSLWAWFMFILVLGILIYFSFN